MPDYILGVDTGGTYTDGVLLNPTTKEVIHSTKTLTTRADLSLGILTALKDLVPEDPESIKLVVISTTLATNAVAEGKGYPVALFLLGYDTELVEQFNLGSRFAANFYHFFQGGHDLYANEQAPLDLDGIQKMALDQKDKVDAFAVSGYFSPFNASHEERAFEILSETVPQPVVLGSSLSTKLNSVQRATTACLNASLLTPLQNFILAMEKTLQDLNISAPLMVVRGDGALVPSHTAKRRPVETVHSGPAASALGGRFLTGIDKALVIDIGGTTTDIALVDEGQVMVKEEGTTVGGYRTSVRAANIHSLGLGGDSKIEIDLNNQLQIGPARVLPLCSLADQHPHILQVLRSAATEKNKLPNPRNSEFWYINRPSTRAISNPRVRTLLKMLEAGPLSLRIILDTLELFHPLQIGATELIKQEIIGVSSLTPTDLFHVRGDFKPWNREAAQIGTSLMAKQIGKNEAEFINLVLNHITLRITRECITYLTGQNLESESTYTRPDDLGAWLFNQNYQGDDPYLGCEISLKMPLIGIGAPADLFLPEVAKLLHTDYISPPHYQVANAVGAAVGSLIASLEAWVIPQSRNERTVGYYVQSGKDRERFRTLQEALSFAKKITQEKVLQDALSLGIQDPHIDTEQLPDGAESYRIRVVAVGSPIPGKPISKNI